MKAIHALPFLLLASALFFGVGIAGAEHGDGHSRSDEAGELHQEVQSVKKTWQAKDPSFKKTLAGSHGYAIFPSVGKGGFLVGASHGKGEVYEKGKLIGHAKMTQVTAGAQVGGQVYAEVILFKDKKALERFTQSRFEGTAAATAVGGTKGAAAASKYKEGVAIMVLPLKGGMAEAAGGGQKFAFTPLGD